MRGQETKITKKKSISNKLNEIKAYLGKVAINDKKNKNPER